jgi:chromatin remodeling complex protein RSC6
MAQVEKNVVDVTDSEVAGTESPVEIVVDPIVQQLSSITELIEVLQKTSKTLTAEMKTLTKDVNKLRLSKVKKAKKEPKPVDPNAPKKVNALEKPVPISEELSKFLGFTSGELVSRQSVTKAINQYVKDNNLQDPNNKRFIIFDSEPGLKLKALLRDPDQPLTFFNIQRYLKPHYLANDSSSPESTARSTKSEAETPKAEEPKAEEPEKKKVIKRVVKKA